MRALYKVYSHIIRRYPKIPLSEERRLILKAQRGSKKSKDELVLRHIGFLIFRIHKVAFPEYARRFGEDLLAESILIVYKKIKTDDLNYCDKRGNPKQVKFVSYIWKRIDGFIIDSLKKESMTRNDLYDSCQNIARSDDFFDMSTL
jgi:DNA-directed RNA polymerase specialized sigma subunit